MATDTCWILSAWSAAVAPLKSDCHFYTIYSSLGLIACFLSEEIFPVKVLHLSFISPLFRCLFVEGFWYAFILKASLLHTSANLPGSGSSKQPQARKSNPTELLWCHYGPFKSCSFQLRTILLLLIRSPALLFESGQWSAREGERTSWRQTHFIPTKIYQSLLWLWFILSTCIWVTRSNLSLHFYFRAGIGKLPVKGQIVNSIGFAGQRIYVTDTQLWQCREHAGTQPLDGM